MSQSPKKKVGIVGRPSGPTMSPSPSSTSSGASTRPIRTRAEFARRTNFPRGYGFASVVRSPSSMPSGRDYGDTSAFWDEMAIMLGVSRNRAAMKKHAELMNYYKALLREQAWKVREERLASRSQTDARWSQLLKETQPTQPETQNQPGYFHGVPMNKHYRWELRERQKW